MSEGKSVSAIILVRDNAEFIRGCLESVSWADELLVVDTGSTDRTVEICQKKGAKVIRVDPQKTFADWRNSGRDAALGEWLLYLDTDERVTPELRDEIKRIIAERRDGVFFIQRRNIFLGKEMRPDKVERLFHRSSLKGWKGELSEQPIYSGKAGTLEACLVHLSHRDLTSMLGKTIAWSKIEAKLLYQAGHPPMSWWRFPRVILTELWRRLVREAYWRYGTPGIIEAIFQTLSVFITYLRLWSLQRVERSGLSKI